jgi:hypothetical protein
MDMRSGRIVPSLGAAVLAAALLVACGGGSGVAPIPAATTSAFGAIVTPVLVAPTPVVPASPITVPTPTVSSSPAGGLPSASPLP